MPSKVIAGFAVTGQPHIHDSQTAGEPWVKVAVRADQGPNRKCGNSSLSTPGCVNIRDRYLNGLEKPAGGERRLDQIVQRRPSALQRRFPLRRMKASGSTGSFTTRC